MKKIYEKPEIEMMDFKINEDIMDGTPGFEESVAEPGDGWM